MKKLQLIVTCLTLILGPVFAHSQAVNTAQQVTLAGLRAGNGHGSFAAAAYTPDGSLILLYDQKDGVRVLKLNASGTSVLAQAYIGAAGDSALALALDPAGNIYVAGTSASGSLSGTSGTAFPSRADTSTNSFLAKFDNNLNTTFITFLGAGRTAVASVAATADAVFVTGITFNAAFPVTENGIQQTPASGTTQNGFVERFSTTGALVYATYVTGANGSIAPQAIVADAQDNAYIAGYTSATGYPTIAALVPEILGTNSGFLTKLAPAGDGFVFSTFIPGGGITGLALDANNQQLLLTGTIAPGQFPLATATTPLAATGYQSLLRIPLSGQTVSASMLLLPGTHSSVTSGPDGTAWITGVLTTPLFPGTSQPLALLGDSFALHITAANTIDQTLRLGGQPAGIFANAALTSVPAAPAISASSAIAIPATLSFTVNPSLASAQRFDLPTAQAPNAALPNNLRDLAAACTGTSQCLLSAGYLTLVSNAAVPALSVSFDNVPNVTLRNLGSASAEGLVLAASGPSIATNCTGTLGPSNSCNVALTGTGAGSFTASAANATTETVHLPANTLTPNAIAVTPAELNFGIQTSASQAATRTLTVTNLSGAAQAFTSVIDSTAKTLPYTLTEFSSTCPGGTTKTLAPGASCTIELSLAATTDTAVHAAWKVANTDIAITAITQIAALNASATAINFGTQFANGLRSPRYLFLSNNSATAIAHTAVTLPAHSPFTVTDECPATLQPRIVCRLALAYNSINIPSADSITMTLDMGLSVIVDGKTLPQQGTTGSAANPSLSVTPLVITFATPVVLTGVSGTTQNVTVKNTGATALTLTAAITGDFTMKNGCPSALLGGSSCQILTTFAPSQPGSRQGLLAIAAGSGFAPTYVTLSGTATAILPPNNGTLDLGQTLVGEPTVAWFKIQQSLASLTIASNSSVFGVAIVEDGGYGHGTLSPAGFNPTATGSCANCYIGIQFLSQTVGMQAATLTLTTIAKGSPYTLTLTGNALPVTGLLLTPISADFGPVAISSSTAPTLFTLANLLTPASAVSITSVTTTGDFSAVLNSSGGQACVGNLASSASCFVQVVFSPTALGLRAGTLTVTTSSGTITTSLTGNGAADRGLAINPTALAFNNTPGTAALQQTMALSNTGATTLTIGAIASSDASFMPSANCTTLAPGAMCVVTVTFKPGFAPTSGTLSITTTRIINGQLMNALQTADLSGLYTTEDAGLQIIPGEVNFGSTPVGSLGVTRLFTLNNLTAKSVAVSLTLPRQFPLTTPFACPTLTAYGSCSFSVMYLPATAGPATGTIFARATPTDGSVTLQALGYMQGYGSAAAALVITGNIIPHAALGFGQPTSGQATLQTLTLTNSGPGTLTVRRITSEPPFLATTTCGVTLAPSAACTVTVTYSPISEILTPAAAPLPRTDTGTITIESDAASSPDMIDLTGSVSPVTATAASNGAMLAAFQLSQGALTFSNTAVGSASSTQTITLANNGTTTVRVLETIPPTDFAATTNCQTLLPGENCSYAISFRPTNAISAPTRTGVLQIKTDASTALEFVTLFGTSSDSPITLSPVALDFGTLSVNTSSRLNVTVTNTSSNTVALTGLTATGDFSAGFGTCPATLAANASCNLQVTFAPTTAGTRTGTLSLSTSATSVPLTVALSGISVITKLQITPGALAFGTIAVGASANLSLALSNVGTAMITGISGQISGPNLADFVITAQCSATLVPAQGCTMTVLFSPNALGPRSATLTIVGSDPAAPFLIQLTGNGGASGGFTLTVNGGPSASATVASGSPATYALNLTPTGGFAGPVALTCAPVNPGTFAACSINPSTVTLNGGSQGSSVTINTITTASLESQSSIYLALLGLPLLFARKSRRLQRFALLLFVGLVGAAALTGCGGGTKAGAAGNLRYTPAGGYQYQITATSVSGPTITQTVTLNLTVQ